MLPGEPRYPRGLLVAIDQKALREAYFNPPAAGEFRDIPTREDYMADAERRFVRLCRERGGDPKAEGLGEHGALIGGPDNNIHVPYFLRRTAATEMLSPNPLPCKRT